MNRKHLLLSFLVVAAMVSMVTIVNAQPVIIKTNQGVGADAEVRESKPLDQRGDNTELASRFRDTTPLPIDNAGDRGAMIYLRFDTDDLDGVDLNDYADFCVKLFYRNAYNNAGHITTSTNTTDPSHEGSNTRTAQFAIYGLNDNTLSDGWIESGATDAISFSNAPGLVNNNLPGPPSDNIGGKDFNTTLQAWVPDNVDLSKFEWLDSQNALDQVGDQSHIYPGQSLIFRSDALQSFMEARLASGAESITFLVAMCEDSRDYAGVFGTNVLGRNYVFIPKEYTAFNNNPGAGNYDPDTTDDTTTNDNVDPPWFNSTNAQGQWNPQLILKVPEPSTLALLGLAGLAALAVTRRRKK